MNETETVTSEALKIGKGTKGARYKRTPEIYPRVYTKNEFSLNDDFCDVAVKSAHQDLALFRFNCRYVCHVKKISLTQVIRALNKQGVKISRETIMGKSLLKHTFPKSLLLSTFALALGVPTWLLLSDNIEADCERLKII